jgi:Protein of unknown function (DUF3311)
VCHPTGPARRVPFGAARRPSGAARLPVRANPADAAAQPRPRPVILRKVDEPGQFPCPFEEDSRMVEPQTGPARRHRSGSPWHWLLVIPVVVPLLVFLFNAKDPHLLGFPRFYWLQLAFILLSAATTLAVYLLTRPREADR